MTVTNHLDQPMLKGLFAPITDELDAADLSITGSLPHGLDGVFMRNGPNPRFEPISGYHMFDGDGMLHAITIRDGAASYRNRWLRTPQFLVEERAGRALYGGLGGMHTPTREERGDAGRTKNPANTNLMRHAGRYYALYEGALPTEFTTDLATLPEQTYGGKLAGSFTAHPRIDPRTGELFAFAYSPFAPHLRAFFIDPDGELDRIVDLDIPACSVMHDFAITETSLVFVDAPLIFDLEGAMAGGSPFKWDHNHGTRIGVVPRDGGDATWHEVDAGYVNHFWNAWDDGDKIVFSGSCSPGTGYSESKQSGHEGGSDAMPGLPTRFTLDRVTGRATAEVINDMPGDFTHINDAYLGVKSRFHTMGAFSGNPDIIGHFDTLVQFDDVNGTHTSWCDRPGNVIGDAVFAAAPDGTEENDGWMVCTVHDRTSGATDVAVLDAHDIAAGPIARIHLPQRLPFGFHAAWFANE